ncbi:MAG: polymerase, sigma-24 subunit, subfamily [Ilumatobacteraceae bacterium]|nr:polymerase, sigma-24 subunit, subfamily [Ilumatobacteraceae bacterium]
MSLRPFDQIVTEHGPTVLRVCRALVGPTDAQDAWSETFLSAMQAYPTLRDHDNIRGWLVTIAHHKAIDQLRRATRQPRPSGSLPDVPVHDGLPARDDDLRAALDALPPKQRGAVIYRYLGDLSYAEVGALLDCSEPAARRSAADGIAALRKNFNPSTRTDAP